MTNESILGDHFHFVIWAALGRTENGYTDVTYVDVIADTEAQAVERARAICPGRNYYHINNVVEHHAHDGEHHG